MNEVITQQSTALVIDVSDDTAMGVELNRLNEGFQTHLKNAAGYALRMGELLFYKKEEIFKEGKDFVSWVERYSPIPHSTANMYIRAWENKEKFADQLTGNETITYLLSLGKEAKAQKKKEEKARIAKAEAKLAVAKASVTVAPIKHETEQAVAPAPSTLPDPAKRDILNAPKSEPKDHLVCCPGCKLRFMTTFTD